MAGMHRRGKKYAGQDRWERDLADIQRVTDAPRVGKVGTRPVEIGGKPVHFDSVLLLDLLRRRENGTENDNLRARRYDGGRPGGKSELTQTESAALRGLPDGNDLGEGDPDNWSRHEQLDPVGIIIEEALNCLDIMARNARLFEKKLELVLNAGSRAKEQADKGGDCGACSKHVSGLGEDRLKSGYGPCCYWKWKDFSAQQDYDGLDQSHVVFQVQRRAEIDAESQQAEVVTA